MKKAEWPKNWCFRTMVLEKTLETPLDCKEIKPVNPKGNQSWIFIGRTNAEAEAPILWPPDVKNWLLGKDPDAGKDWRWEEKGATEDEMVGWPHWLNGHEFEQASGVCDGQGSLACYSPWGCKELDKTQWLNWGHKNIILPIYDCGEREVECVTFLPSETFKRAGLLAFHRFYSLSSEWWENCIPDWDQSIEPGFPTSPMNLNLLSCF